MGYFFYNGYMRKYTIDKINKSMIFKFDFDKDVVDAIKNCDYNSHWNTEFKHWVIPINQYNKNSIIWIINNFNFEKSEVKKVEDVKFSYKLSSSLMDKLKIVCDKQKFTYTPRSYQMEALGYSLNKQTIINGDDVGLGKTFEAIMYAEVTNSFPCLVVVPASVKYNWLEKWLEITNNKRSVSVIESKETKKHKNNWGADVVLINYDIIGKRQGKGATVKFKELVETKWKMTIFDEAHFLKNKDSQRAKASKKITKPNDLKIQLLSGTITMSRPVELWNLLVLAKVNDQIANDWHHFITRYCGGYRGKFGWVTDGATNMLELNRKLRNICYIRREKREVLKDLPNVIRQVIHFPITNKKDIEKATNDFIEFIKETKGEESAEKAMEAQHLVALNTLRLLAIEGKIKAIEQYLKDWGKSGRKLVVFGLHREALEGLSKKFKAPIIIGGVSSKKKQQIVNDWKTSKEVFLMVNMEAGGTGIDGLQDVCSDMLIIELPWRPSDLSQTIGRIDRSGQKNTPVVTFALNNDTIDSKMWQMLCDKEQVTEATNKGVDIEGNETGMKVVMKKFLENK